MARRGPAVFVREVINPAISSQIRASGMGETATYIYCIIHRARRPVLTRLPRGLPGASKPALLAAGDSLWAVVAEVPLARYGPAQLETGLQDLRWVAQIAVQHEAVVEYCAQLRGATVVPMKLFTMFSNPVRARGALGARRRQLAAILERIRGCDEWGVRVGAAHRTATADRKGTRDIRSGTAFLSAKKQARDDAVVHARRAVETAEATFVNLGRIAKDSRRRSDPDGVTTPLLLDATFLVPSRRKASFRAAARQAAQACRSAGAELTLSGPWPAYNFVEESDRGSFQRDASGA